MTNRLLKRFADLIVRRHWAIIIVCVLLMIVLSVMATRVGYTDAVEKFLPEGNAETVLFHKINREFGGLNIALVGLEFPQLFTKESLAKVDLLTQALSGIPGVYHINSITNTVDLTGDDVGANLKNLIPRPIPKDPAVLAKLKKKVLNRPLIVGSLVSKDATSTLLVCVLRGDANPKEMAETIKKTTLDLLGSKGIYFGGSPFLAEYMVNGARKDLRRLTPFVCGVILLIMLYLFRRLKGVLLATISIIASISCTVGLMAVFHVSLNLLSSSLPIIVLAVGSAYVIHILAKYYEGLDAGYDAERTIRWIFDEVSIPVFVAGVTTIIGFASFSVMDIQPMREFGVFLAVGIFFGMLFAGLFTPAALYALRGKLERPHRALQTRSTSPQRFVDATHRHRWLIAGVTVVVAAGSLYYSTQINVDMSTKHLYQRESEPWKAERFINTRFGGSIYLQLYVSADIRHPLVLKELERLNEFIVTQDNVSNIQSIVGVLKLLNKAMNNVHRLPGDLNKSKELASLIDGQPWLKMLVNKRWDAALINIKLAEFDTQKVKKLIGAITAFTRQRASGAIRVLDTRLLSSAQQGSLRSFRMDQLLTRLRHILARRNRYLTASTEKALRTAWGRQAQVEQDKRAALAIRNYLAGDSAAIDLAQPKRVGVISDALLRMLNRGDSPQQTLAYLKSAAQKDFANDLKNLTKANRSVWEVVEDQRKQRVVETLGPIILAELNPSDRGALKSPVENALIDLRDPLINARGAGALQELAQVQVPMKIEASGYPVLYEGMNRSVRHNQLNSMVISLILVFLTLAGLFRSWLWGLIAIAPTGLTLLFTFGLMGVLKIPLDMGSSMITSITLGVGIDYAIHFLWRFRQLGPQSRTALVDTLHTTGKAIIYNAITVTVGFSILIFATIVPIIKLGSLVAETMMVSAVLTLVLIPLVFTVFFPEYVPQRSGPTLLAEEALIPKEKES